MRVTNYSSFDRTYLGKQIAAFEEAQGVEVQVVRNRSLHAWTEPIRQNHEECAFTLVLGNPTDRGLTYTTIDGVEPAAILSDAAGWGRGGTTTFYDIPTLSDEALAELGHPGPIFFDQGLDDASISSHPWIYVDYVQRLLYVPDTNQGVYLDWDIVFEPVVHQLLDSLGSPEERAAAAHERALERLSEYYAEGSTADLVNLRDEIGGLMRDLTSYENAVVHKAETLREKQLLLDQMLDAMKAADSAQEARAAFDAMASHPKIEGVTIQGNVVAVKTVGLDIEHPDTGEVGYLGKFNLTLDLASGSMKCHNLDNRRNGYDHPHVHIGNPCFGEMGTTIMSLIRTGKLLDAVEMAFVFLESANTRDDWGRTIVYWTSEQLERPQPTTEAVAA